MSNQNKFHLEVHNYLFIEKPHQHALNPHNTVKAQQQFINTIVDNIHKAEAIRSILQSIPPPMPLFTHDEVQGIIEHVYTGSSSVVLLYKYNSAPISNFRDLKSHLMSWQPINWKFHH